MQLPIPTRPLRADASATCPDQTLLGPGQEVV